ncbi:MAG TPA: AbiV family abortive infection protein, partial [Caulobacteraceae bacterium]
MTGKIPQSPLLDGEASLRAAIEAAARPGRGYGDRRSEGFDAAGEHVVSLLGDATHLFERGSFGTATFLAITALEETAKADLLSFRREGTAGERPKGRDPLRSHADKHLIAVRSTVFMGKRLLEALGQERCEALKVE